MTDQQPPAPHVAIIGAGVSGLRCAGILLDQGFRVTILEARDRIGGRICQSDELGYTVDLGPNWIHASGLPEHPNPILQAAKDTDTPLHRWNDKQLIYDSSGIPLDSEKADRLSTILWETIEEAFAFSEAAHNANPDDEARGHAIPANESLYDFISQRAVDKIPDEDDRELLLQMSEMFGAYIGEPIWKQSLRFAWLEECCGGDEVFVASDYSKILDKIAAPARAGAEIKLKTYIQAISTPTSRNDGTRITLLSKDKRPMTFDELVVTTPLGWLKKNYHETFVPSLPPRLCAAIDNISLSYLEKVFITFPSAYWSQNGGGEEFPAYTNWLRPSYATDTNPRRWPQEVWDLSAFAAPNRHPTLLFYLYGDCSRHVVSTVGPPTTPEEEEQEFRFLNAFFSPYYSNLPGYDPTNPDCIPKAILASRWQADPLSGNASYCNFQIGSETADEDVMALRDGCPDRRLWFCGEHAAPFEECGTVAGAYLSGEAAGKKIVEIYGRGTAHGS